MQKDEKYIHAVVRAGALIFFIGLLYITPSKAQFYIRESFKGNNVSNQIILGGDAKLTSGWEDPVNEGWLRLTTDATERRGYAFINTSFPSSLGVYIDFEYKTWRTRYAHGFDQGADGFSVFLFDGSVTRQNFRIGAYGGSLGYANEYDLRPTPGLYKGYIGIGFDEYGNFATDGRGKNGGVNKEAPNSIVLRGPAEPVNGKKPYRYLEHVQYETSATRDSKYSIDYNNRFITGRPGDGMFYRRVRIYIEPIGTSGQTQYRISVFWRSSQGEDDELLLTYDTVDPIPETLKIGFAASTGLGVNYHEVRNMLVSTPGGVRVQKMVDKENAIPGDELTYTVEVYNESNTFLNNLGFADSFQLSDGSLASVDDFEISSITFNNGGDASNTAEGFTSGVPVTSGLTNSFNSKISIGKKQRVTFTVKGRVKRIVRGNALINSAEIDPSETGIEDTDLTNNYASVTTSILNPNLDLSIRKEVDNNGVVPADGQNTFSIIVENVSMENKYGSSFWRDHTVTVTETIPEGLEVVGSMSYPGWSRSISGRTYTFTRKDALSSQSAYDPITITVRPRADSKGPWENKVTLHYRDDTNPNNNSSSAWLRRVNYWIGGDPGNKNGWNTANNWTANFVPVEFEDIEFATEENNPTKLGYAKSGPAKEDLYLDKDRTIGNLVNQSNKNLVITPGNLLVINEDVHDDNPNGGDIIVKADPNDQLPAGSLKFAKPDNNRNRMAVVEFYNQAYDCADCGTYTRSWQYFGIPVRASDKFPYEEVPGNETVNQWVEPFNGNKWQPAPYAPDTQLEAFKGYQITNDASEKPSGVYAFSGVLHVGDASVALSRTNGANYAGVNLVGNSFTAAIPISEGAMTFPAGVEKTVYLFNTGTRNEWRKLNGSAVNQRGYKRGQYLAVPVSLGGQTHFPDKIPSMHAFMLRATEGTGGNLVIKYSELVKNTKVALGDGTTEIVTRSAGVETDKSMNGASGGSDTEGIGVSQQLPSLVMDVIGEESADRVWIFAKEGTSYGFDNGWDGRKMSESGMAQLYVSDESGKEKFQVATVPSVDNLSIGFEADADGEYTLEFALSDHWKSEEVYLLDQLTGERIRIKEGGSYTFLAKKEDAGTRFVVSYAGEGVPGLDEAAQIIVNATEDGKILVHNGSSRECSVFVSNADNSYRKRLDVAAGKEGALENVPSGIYLVRLQNGAVHDVRKVAVE